MANFLRPKNYPIMVSPNLEHAWVNIPKNCSSFIQKVLDDNGWIIVNHDLVDSILSSSSIEKIVVLRDPLQRWISGFAESCGIPSVPNLKLDLDKLDELLENNTFWTLICNNLVMCDHTEYQHRFIANGKNVKYIKLQEKDKTNNINDPNRFYKDFSKYIKYTGGTSNFLHWNTIINPVDNDQNKSRIYNKIISMMEQDPSIPFEIKDFHQDDYELFNNLERFTV